jgi:hypothetical protein
VVWVQTAFGPTIHHLSPCSTFALPWFQLRDRSRKLSPEYVASPQWTVVVDLVILDEDLQSAAQICPLQINGSDLPFSNRRPRPASRLGLQTFQTSNLLCLLPLLSGAKDLTTCSPPEINGWDLFGSPDSGKNKTQTLFPPWKILRSQGSDATCSPQDQWFMLAPSLGTSDLFLWCYTLRNFGLLNAREPLI